LNTLDSIKSAQVSQTEPKTFGPGGAGPAVAKAPSKRKFFASFFKKEALAFFP
jgi:hypothetical protein